MNARLAVLLLCVVGVGLGCATRPESVASRNYLSAQVEETVALFKIRDPGIQAFFDRSYGYAVLPRITKGALVVGGAHGKGEVFAGGAKVGYCSMTQASIGFSFGGEFFREIIFFRDKADLDRFRMGDFTFSGQATAVALTAGAAAKSDYEHGMAVFVMPDSGLMVDASIAGQKFSYDPAFTMREEPPTVLP
jgi:lipid-binding SYLF domain-containing protein